MSLAQMMAYSSKDWGWSYQQSCMKHTYTIYMRGICQPVKYRRMEDNTSTGLESMLTSKTTLWDAKNALRGTDLAKEPLQPHDIP